ncbi:MAG: hypothetical protein ACLTUE_10225 [Oscillospiraceae bacterium]
MFQFDEQDANGQFMITVPQAAEPQPSTSAVVTYGSDDPVSVRKRRGGSVHRAAAGQL